MTMNVYQILASRTMRDDLTKKETLLHALHGISAEVGEIHGIFQKEYQGHKFDEEHLKKEVGDLMWFVAELCTVFDWKLDEVSMENILKLEKRYPEGFEVDKSTNRVDEDV